MSLLTITPSDLYLHRHKRNKIRDIFKNKLSTGWQKNIFKLRENKNLNFKIKKK